MYSIPRMKRHGCQCAKGTFRSKADKSYKLCFVFLLPSLASSRHESHCSQFIEVGSPFLSDKILWITYGRSASPKYPMFPTNTIEVYTGNASLITLALRMFLSGILVNKRLIVRTFPLAPSQSSPNWRTFRMMQRILGILHPLKTITSDTHSLHAPKWMSGSWKYHRSHLECIPSNFFQRRSPVQPKYKFIP